MRALLALPLLLSLGCGGKSSQSSENEVSPEHLECDEPGAWMTGPPILDPPVVPAGQARHVNLEIPVTRDAYQVIVQISRKQAASGSAIGIVGDAYNVDKACSVDVGVDLHAQVEPGQYFAVVSAVAESDPNQSWTFADYDLQPLISTTNYTVIALPLTMADSQIAIPFLSVE